MSALEDLRDLRAELDEAAQILEGLRVRRLELVAVAHGQGVSWREIAENLGLSTQRLAQLREGLR